MWQQLIASPLGYLEAHWSDSGFVWALVSRTQLHRNRASRIIAAGTNPSSTETQRAIATGARSVLRFSGSAMVARRSRLERRVDVSSHSARALLCDSDRRNAHLRSTGSNRGIAARCTRCRWRDGSQPLAIDHSVPSRSRQHRKTDRLLWRRRLEDQTLVART